MVAIAALSVPTSGVGIPTTSLGARVRYRLDVKGKQGVQALLTLQGERSWISLGVERLGWGP